MTGAALPGARCDGRYGGGGLYAGAPSGGQALRKAITAQRRAVAASSVLGISHQTGEAMVPVLIGVIIDRDSKESCRGFQPFLLRR